MDAPYILSGCPAAEAIRGKRFNRVVGQKMCGNPRGPLIGFPFVFPIAGIKCQETRLVPAGS